MNKIITGLMLAALPCLASAQSESNYTLSGTVKNIHPAHVYLVYYGSKGLVRDSAQVTGQQYKLTGYAEAAMVATLTSAGPEEDMNPYNSVSIFLEPSEHFSIAHTNTFDHIAITGSPANTEYKKLLDRNKQYKEDADKTEKIYGDYLRANPSSPIGMYALEYYAQGIGKLNGVNAKKILALVDLFPDAEKNGTRLTAFRQKLTGIINADEKVAIGKEAPDFTQNDTSGNAITLSSFRGKYVLVDFWASWCGPCRQENPHVVAAYQKYHSKGFEILGVSLDQEAANWKKAIRTDKLAWVHVSDLKYWSNAVAVLYGVQGVPQNYLVDPQGKIIASSLRGEELEKKLAEIYNN